MSADLFNNEPPASEPGAAIVLDGKVVAEIDIDDGPDEFDWSTSDEDIILGEQLATACYRNRRRAVVIRQEGSGYDDRDHYVVLRDAEAVRAVIAALQRELKAGWP